MRLGQRTVIQVLLIVVLAVGLAITINAGLPWLQNATLVIVAAGSGVLAMVVKRNRQREGPSGNDRGGGSPSLPGPAGLMLC